MQIVHRLELLQQCSFAFSIALSRRRYKCCEGKHACLWLMLFFICSPLPCVRPLATPAPGAPLIRRRLCRKISTFAPLDFPSRQETPAPPSRPKRTPTRLRIRQQHCPKPRRHLSRRPPRRSAARPTRPEMPSRPPPRKARPPVGGAGGRKRIAVAVAVVAVATIMERCPEIRAAPLPARRRMAQPRAELGRRRWGAVGRSRRRPRPGLGLPHSRARR